ncbi:MAG: DNA repair protein RecO [Oscillospiraceae bacterium]
MSSQTRTVNGIVLKQSATKESDEIITVLSKELGVINIYAKGARRLKNKFHSSVGVFTYSEFVIFEPNSSKLYQLNEGSVKHIFYALSEKVEYLALAMYMSELVREVSVPDEMTEEILRLFLNTLHMLTTEKWTVNLCKAAFEMRLMCNIGYRPNLLGCKKCGKYEDEGFLFDTENGEIVCPDCAREYDMGCIICEPSTLMALRYIAYADLEMMFTFSISGYYLHCLGRICQRFVSEHTKHEYKTLAFLRSVQPED